MKDNYILAIETSCDETAMTIMNNNKIIASVINSQIESFEKLGGVVPEMASRLHQTNIFKVYKELFQQVSINIKDISKIAITYGPGLIGSLLVGVNFAKTLSMLYNIPIIPINHMQAHVTSILIEHNIDYPHLSLIISGGHTELVYQEDKYNYNIIGETLDDAVGECYDKVARMLGLNYPGGPEIDKLSINGNKEYDLPLPKNDKSLDMSFSGLKSACLNLINTKKMKNEEININDFCFSFQDTIYQILKNKIDLAIREYKVKSISIVGGVSANSYLRSKLENNYNNIYFPSKKYATDNADMIGYLAYILDEKDTRALDININANPSLGVEDKWIN